MNNRRFIKRFLLLALMAVATMPAMAQKDDIGMWIGADVSKELSKKWEVGFGAEYRLNDELSATERLSVSVDAKYKVAKWLKAGVGYTYLHGREPKSISDGGKYLYNTYWYPRHRFTADLTGSFKLGRFKISLRERWMYTYRPSFERNRMGIIEGDEDFGIVSHKDKDGKGENVLRSRLQVQYDIRKSKFTPYASFESFNAWAVQKVRYTIGTSYKLTKRDSVKLYYLFENKNQRSGGDPVQDSHIIGINYSHSL